MKMQLKFPNNAYATLHSPHKYVSEDMDKNKKIHMEKKLCGHPKPKYNAIIFIMQVADFFGIPTPVLTKYLGYDD